MKFTRAQWASMLARSLAATPELRPGHRLALDLEDVEGDLRPLWEAAHGLACVVQVVSPGAAMLAHIERREKLSAVAVVTWQGGEWPRRHDRRPPEASS